MNQTQAFNAAAKKAGWRGTETTLWAIARGAYSPKTAKARETAERAIAACAALCPGWGAPGNPNRKLGVPSRG